MTDKRNGEANVTPEDLDPDTKLNILIEAIVKIQEQQDEILVQNQEIIEKLSNISLPGVDYDYE